MVMPYGTYWRGPYFVTKVTPMPMVYGPHDKVSYTIRNLTTGKENLADVTVLLRSSVHDTTECGSSGHEGICGQKDIASRKLTVVSPMGAGW